MNIFFRTATLVLFLANGSGSSNLFSMESRQAQENLSLSNNQRILALGTGLGLGGLCMYYTTSIDNVRPYIGLAIKDHVKKEFENVKNNYQDNSTVLKLAGGLFVIFGLNHLINNWYNQPTRLVLSEAPKIQEQSAQNAYLNTIISIEPKKTKVLMHCLVPIMVREERSEYMVEKVWFDKRAKSIVKNGYEIGSKDLRSRTVKDWFSQTGQVLLPIEVGIAHWNGACNYGNGIKTTKVYVDAGNELRKLVCDRQNGTTTSTRLLSEGKDCSLITATSNGVLIGCVHDKKQVIIFENDKKRFYDFDSELTALAFNQNNIKFAVTTIDNRLIIASTQFGRSLSSYVLKKTDASITSIAFVSRDNNNIFAVGYADGMIGYFMSDTNTWLYWQAHNASIDEIKLLDNNQTVISCSTIDKKVKKWSLEDVAKSAFTQGSFV